MSYKCEAYSCEFCNMTSKLNHSVLRHERDSCKKNPKRKTCLSCEHLYSQEEYDPHSEKTVSFRVCELEKETFLSELNSNIDCEDFKLKLK